MAGKNQRLQRPESLKEVKKVNESKKAKEAKVKDNMKAIYQEKIKSEDIMND